MQGFFNPRSLVIVGVSPRPGNLGRNIVANLDMYGYPGTIHLVSPKGGEYKGRKIYTQVSELPETPDLAVVFTPAAVVPAVMEACGKKGIKRAIIESGGFSELDASRSDLEEAILKTAQTYGMRFIGPNCIGVISTHAHLAVPFPQLSQPAPQGGISIISQSGGVGLTYLLQCIQNNMGVAKFSSVGNKLNVNEEDLLEYLIQDEQTKVILLYLESIVAGRRLFELIRSTDKPVVVHKSNIGDLSRAIAHSHTAALANDDQVVQAALQQAGAIRSHGVAETITILKGLLLPRPRGRRLVVISRSGGHAVVAADAAYREKLELPPLPDSYLQSFKEHLRASVIHLQNPLDLGDLFDFKVYLEILEGALKLPESDGVVVIHGYRGPEKETSREFVRRAGELGRQYDKPVSLCLLVDNAELEAARQISSIPIHPTAEDAISALAHSLPKTGTPGPGLAPPPGQKLDQARRIVEACADLEEMELPEALHLVAAAGVPVAKWVAVVSDEDAAQAADHLGYPVVLKAVGISHKTEAGGVVMGLGNRIKVRRAAAKLFKNLRCSRLVVMRQAAGQVEAILGAKQDPSFGTVLLFGLGGITAELLKDVSLRLAPVSREEAGEMLEDLKGAALFKGYRGKPACQREAILEAIERIAWLAAGVPRIMELDINPLLAGPEGVLAVDARVVLQKQPPKN